MYQYYLYRIRRQIQRHSSYFPMLKEQDRRFPEALFRAPHLCYGLRKEQHMLRWSSSKGNNCVWNYSFSYDNYLKGIVDFTDAIEKNKKEFISLIAM